MSILLIRYLRYSLSKMEEKNTFLNVPSDNMAISSLMCIHLIPLVRPKRELPNGIQYTYMRSQEECCLSLRVKG